jgi:hypothetical protein
MKIKAVNHKSMIYHKGTLVLEGGEEVRKQNTLRFY